jgi:hypothetical protein
MDRWNRHLAGWLLLAAFVAASGACSSGATGNRGPSIRTTSETIIFCGPMVAADDADSPRDEFYVVPAIQKKLRDYPAFADYAVEAGITSIASCDEGRAFMSVYASYKGLHPTFDANQPIDLPPPLPKRPAFDPQVAKIQNGTVSTKFQTPLLQALIPIPDGGAPQKGRCSGVFIAKNWIATAAHCMNPAQTNDPENPIWHGYYPFNVARADQSGMSTALLMTNILVLQYPDTRFMGASPSLQPSQFGDYDFGLLYLPADFYDNPSPFGQPIVEDPRFPTPPALPDVSTDTAMRISLVPPDPTHNMVFYGWGKTNPTDVTTLQLHSGPLAPITQINVGSFNTMVPAGTVTQAVPCIGDSGGPVVDTLNVPGVGSVEVVAGLHSGNARLNTACGAGGDTLNWVRMDTELAWIESSIQQWTTSLFKCKQFFINDADPTPTYARCWGDPCTQDSDCDQSVSPQVCGGLQVGTAIVGQCLPADPSATPSNTP